MASKRDDSADTFVLDAPAPGAGQTQALEDLPEDPARPPAAGGLAHTLDLDQDVVDGTRDLSPAPSDGRQRGRGADEPRMNIEQPGRYTLLDWSAFAEKGRHIPASEAGEATIGAGGMGRVLLAFDEHLERLLALKESHAGQSGGQPSSWQATPASQARFLQEARITGALQHPNIVPVHELGLRGDRRQPYYTMRLVRGRSMAEALEQAQDLRARLALLPHMADLCHAIAYAHSQRVVHRDIKPDNVMIGEFGETVVLDWGIAKVLDAQRPSPVSLALPPGGSLSSASSSATLGGLLGTPAYMAPERVLPQPGPVDPQGDIWALGVVLYQLLTGTHPVPWGDMAETMAWLQDPSQRVEPVAQRCPDAPTELASIAMRCLQRDQSKRYQDAREVARDIERYQAGERVVAHRYTTWEIVRHSVSRNPALSAGVAVGALAAVLAGGLLWDNHNTRLEAERLRRQKAFESVLLAQDASNDGRPLEAKARLRSAIEVEDMQLARTLWRQLKAQPLMWSRELHTEVTGLSFSPDGASLAVAKASPELLLMDTLTRAERPLAGSGENLYVVAWSGGGDILAAGAGNGDLLLWTLPDPQPRVLGAHSDLVSCLAVDRSGRRLLSGSFDGQAMLHDLVSGQRLVVFRGHEGPITSLAWAPDQRRFATTGADGTVRVWRSDQPDPVLTLEGHEEETTGVAFSADGETLYSTGFDSSVRAWNLSTGESSLLDQQTVGFTTLGASPERGLVVAGSLDGSIHVISSEGDAVPRHLEGHKAQVVGMAVSPGGAWLASGSDDRTVRLWDLTAAEADPGTIGHAGAVSSVAWSPDGARLISGGWDGTARLWDAASGQQLAVLDGHGGKVHSAALRPDAAQAATAGTDRAVRIWDLSTGEVQRFLSGHQDEVVSLSFHPQQAQLASGAEDGMVWVWDLSTGVGRLALEGWGSTRVAYSPDGDGLAMARSDWQGGELLLLEEQQIRTSTLLDGLAIESIAYGADPHRLFVMTRGGALLAWDTTTGALDTLRKVEGTGNAVAPSPVAGTLAFSSSTAAGFTVEDDGGATLVPLPVRDSPIADLAFHPAGTTLATASYDGTVRTWRHPSARPAWRGTALLPPLGLWLGHQGWRALGGRRDSAPTDTTWAEHLVRNARQASTSSDGGLICSADHSGEVQLWDRSGDRRLRVVSDQHAVQVLALEHGCVFLRPDGRVDLLDAEAHRPGLHRDALALGTTPTGILAVGAGWLRESSLGGDPTGDHRLRLDRPSAVLRTPLGYAVGAESGRVQMLTADGSGLVQQGQLQNTAPSRVRVLAAGPADTIAVGFEDGSLGVWNPTTSRRLLARQLHGPVTALGFHEGRLHALTELGDYASLDLTVLEQSYCELLGEIQSELPVCWDGNEASFCEPNPSPDCGP
jgi:WD40 repeat protein/serine/threonine protein kinase